MYMSSNLLSNDEKNMQSVYIEKVRMIECMCQMLTIGESG